MTATEYFMKEYNIVRITKKSPLKVPKTTSILQTPPANKVCKKHNDARIVYLFVFCIKRNTEQHKCASPRAAASLQLRGKPGQQKKTCFFFFFLDEGKENESISGEIG